MRNKKHYVIKLSSNREWSIEGGLYKKWKRPEKVCNKLKNWEYV
jgi:hypothetical protein